MTITQIVTSLKTISLAHNSIVAFRTGEDFLVTPTNKKDYPLVFLEMPFSLNYDADLKSVSFALLVLVHNNKQDDINGDMDNISEAEQIAEAILEKFKADNKTTIRMISINALTVRRFTVDGVSGIRFELTLQTTRTFCHNNYINQFS